MADHLSPILMHDKSFTCFVAAGSAIILGIRPVISGFPNQTVGVHALVKFPPRQLNCFQLADASRSAVAHDWIVAGPGYVSGAGQRSKCGTVSRAGGGA